MATALQTIAILCALLHCHAHPWGKGRLGWILPGRRGESGSGIRDPGWVKIRIRDKHPGSATLEKMLGRIPTLPLFQWLRLCKPLQFFVPFCIVMPTHGEKGGWGEFCRVEGGNRKHEMMMWGWWWNDLLFTFCLQRNFPRAWEEHILLLAFALLWDLCFTPFFLNEYCIWLLACLALESGTNWRKVSAGLEKEKTKT